MTPRSLVGMSQRRRKEMFHVEFEAAREKDGTVSMFVADALLSKYRIGQRLRPCPGNGCRRGQSWCLRCDGTGVVSAKPKKVRR